MCRTRTAEEIHKRINEEKAMLKEWTDLWNGGENYDYTQPYPGLVDFRELCLEHIQKHESAIGVLYWMLYK